METRFSSSNSFSPRRVSSESCSLSPKTSQLFDEKLQAVCDERRTSLKHICPILFKRSLLVYSRESHLIVSRFKYLLFFCIILTIVWTPLKKDQTSIQNRIGLLHLITSMGQTAGFSIGAASMRNDKLNFLREISDGLYSSLAYFVIYFVIAIPLLIVPSLLCGFLMSYVVGLGTSPMHILDFAFVILCLTTFGECIGVFCTSIFHHSGVGYTLIGMVTTLTGKFCLNLSSYYLFCNVLTCSSLSLSFSLFIFLCRFNDWFYRSCRTFIFSPVTPYFSLVLGRLHTFEYCFSKCSLFL
jgi:hypothetical protein